MPQPKKIILHIGLPKTGTTSIQRNLRQKDSEIKKYGYLYPSRDARFPDGHVYNENHSKLLLLLFKKNPEEFGEFSALNLKNRILRRAKPKLEESLIAEILKPQLDAIIFSSEALPQLVEGELSKLKHFFQSHLPGCEFEIVLFCRHPIDHAASTFQQSSKFIGNPHAVITWSYSSILTKFSRVFGGQAISLYKFEEAIERGASIVQLFFEKVGLPVEIIDDHDVLNPSLSQTALDLLTHINSRYPLMIEQRTNDTVVCTRGWGRVAEDIRPLISVPGAKCVMDFSGFPDFMTDIRHESNWLKENYDISYEVAEPELGSAEERINSKAIKYIADQLPKLNPFVLKLTYDYFDEMSLDSPISSGAQTETKRFLQEIRSRHPILTKLPAPLLGFIQEIRIRIGNMGLKLRNTI